MKALLNIVLLVIFAMLPVMSFAQTSGVPPDMGASPLSQPLIREGTLAVQLAGGLNLTATENEADAEDALNAVGIAPSNGWIADYPVTPDIVGELQDAITSAADSGKLSISKDAAVLALQNATSANNLPLMPDESGAVSGEASVPGYPDASAEDNYYSSEGPPVVTYYSPPPDYAYMYNWVAYPFWWQSVWFPGFFILTDFNVRVHGHHRGHDHDEFVTNHFHNPKTGVTSRIDPVNRFRSGTFSAEGHAGFTGQRARTGAEAVFNRNRGVQAPPTSPVRQYRGYGVTTSPAGGRSSAFEHSVNGQAEHAASDRGFQSRSSAGQIPAAGRSGGVPHGGGAVSAPRTGGFSGGGFHGGGNVHR